MARCTAIKANGARCGGVAIEGSEWCYQHDPDRARERQRNASKGGRRGGRSRGGGGGSAEAAAIRALLHELTEGVQAHRIPTGTATVLVQVANARSRLIEVERRIKEVEELEERITALEERAGAERRSPRRAR